MDRSPGAAGESAKVLYVIGRGRSGSTIFSNVLGELDGFFSAGEIRYLWDPLLARGLCACGEPVASCPVWSAVLDRIGGVDARQMAAWQHEIVKERNTVRLLRAPRQRTGWPALDGYAQVTRRVYAALVEVTGARVIVDSSKRPSYAAALRHALIPAPHYLHLVRDPRASAYSWRHRRHESVRGEGREVTRRNVVDSTVRWTLLNLGAEAVRRAVGPQEMMRLRFEDFLAAPRPVVASVCAWLEESPAKSPFLDRSTIRLGVHHTLAGNPARFSTGEVELRSKEEWRDRQTMGERLAASTLSLPFLLRYGYPLRP